MKRTQIGGQAVMEGVMMRGAKSMATAVRNSEGKIVVESKRITPTADKNVLYKIPVIRGVLNFVSMLVTGMNTLLRSSEVFGEVIEPSKFDKWVAKKFNVDMMKIVIGFSVILGILLAVGLFVFLPQVITTALFKIPALAAAPVVVFSVIEGVIRLTIFVLYVSLCTLAPDVKRVFMYHGAEHKTINCFEHDEALTVENVQKYGTIHNRCGTTFMVLVMIISILVLALASWLTVDVFEWPDNFGIKLAVRLIMLPLIAGISYEILKLLAKSDNLLVRIIRWPGLQLQRLTTKRPEDDMVEVAIKAFMKVYEMDADDTVPETSFDAPIAYADARAKIEAYAKGVEKSDIDWVFCEALKVGRAELASATELTAAQFYAITEYVEQLNTGKPLQYVLGYTEFYGVKISVDENVLIPRPETELLAEQVIKIASEKSVLDLCTGSGAIAIAVKVKVESATVTASDISEKALKKARENAKSNNVEIEFVESDLFDKLLDKKFDIIVSNPPYIRTEDIEKLDKNVKEFEPISALDGGTDGLDYYRSIIDKSKDYLNENGVLMLEIGINECDEVKKLALEKYASVEVVKDFDGIDRIVIAK